MKKILIGSSFALLAMVALSSCKKDYTCTCTTSDGTTSISASTTINDTKKKATEACEEGSTSSGGFTTTCEIVE